MYTIFDKPVHSTLFLNGTFSGYLDILQIPSLEPPKIDLMPFLSYIMYVYVCAFMYVPIPHIGGVW